MLKDELKAIKAIFREAQQTELVNTVPDCDDRACFSGRVQKVVKEIGNAWTQAAFSDVPEHSLKRYFQFHLEGIRHLSDTIFGFERSENELYKSKLEGLNVALVSLIRFMAERFAPHFDRTAVAPQSFHIETFATLAEHNLSLQNDIARSQIDPSLKKSLSDYLSEMIKPAPATRYTFGSLFYYQNFVEKLSAMKISRFGNGLDRQLAGNLVSLNFNQLDFMLYHANVIMQQVGKDFNKLKLTRDYYKWCVPDTEPCYTSWPPITSMLAGWLDEELAAVKAVPAVSEKLSLNLSVAHLACLTRLFFEENIYNSQALTAIFKFIAGHFQTKRQTRISTGSLSKEYYSINQVTAAVVRDKLLKMVARINHDYFPAVVVIAGAVLLCSASH